MVLFLDFPYDFCLYVINIPFQHAQLCPEKLEGILVLEER